MITRMTAHQLREYVAGHMEPMRVAKLKQFRKTTVAALEVAHRKLLRLEKKLALKRNTTLPDMDKYDKLKNELSETPQGVIEWKSFCTRWGYSPDHSAISFFPHWRT